MKRVIVIGCPGAGKSTFSRAIANVTGLPLFHLDMIYHKPDRTTVSSEEFDSRLSEITSRECWIIDGNYQRTLEYRISRCDTVFLFDLPTDICLAGAKERVGKVRPDMPWVENELDVEFAQFIKEFAEEQLPMIYELLEKHKDKNITVFRSREQADEYLTNIKEIKV